MLMGVIPKVNDVDAKYFIKTVVRERHLLTAAEVKRKFTTFNIPLIISFGSIEHGF